MVGRPLWVWRGPIIVSYDVTSQLRTCQASSFGPSCQSNIHFSHCYHPTLDTSIAQLTYILLPTVIMDNSLAAFRDGRSGQLRQLAEEHLQHEYAHHCRCKTNTADSS
jgi:hypothetical protein